MARCPVSKILRIEIIYIVLKYTSQSGLRSFCKSYSKKVDLKIRLGTTLVNFASSGRYVLIGIYQDVFQ